MLSTPQSPLYLVPALLADLRGDLLFRLPYLLVGGAPENVESANDGAILFDLTHESLDDLAVLCQMCSLPVIALVADGDEALALESGARDALPVEQLTVALVERALRYAIERASLHQQINRQSGAWLSAEMRLTNLIDNNRDGIVVVDVDCVICYINPAAVELFGRDRDQLVGSPLGFSLGSGDLAEMEILQTSGDVATVELYAMQTEWEHRPAQLLSMRNITTRKSAEVEQREWEKLLVALEKEKEMSRVRTNFMNTIIHEFRTPLSVIQSASDLLDTYYDKLTVEKRRLRFDTIKSQIRQLDTLLSEISLTVHAETGQLLFNPVPLNLEEVCQKFIDDLRQTIGASHIFVFDIDRNDDYKVMADPKLLMHIIPNLLSNAIKYSSPGLEITVRLYQDRDTLVISVADHGIGIPLEDQKHLFESFRRGSNVGTINGTGLGLKLVKDCVTVHGGSLTVDSTEGVGTTCTIRLPRVEVEPDL